MGRPLKIKESSTVDIGFNNPTGEGAYFGVVGGTDTLSTGANPVIKIRVKVGSNAEADGYIIRQKGATKYLVSDGTNTGVCVLADKADAALAADEMTITAQDSGSTEFRIKRMSNKFAIDFSDTRYVINFFDVNSAVEKSGSDSATTTLELAQVDNYSMYG